MYQGKQLREVRTTERIIESGKVTEAKTAETTPPPKPIELSEEEKQLAKGLEALNKYEAKYPGDR
jgi:hypothetical protein